MSIQVITNNVPRDVVYDWDVTLAERKEFDYIDWPACDAGRDSATFFRYKGQLHDLSEFVESPPLSVEGWDAFRSDSFFSGLVIRYLQNSDGDQVIVGLVLG